MGDPQPVLEIQSTSHLRTPFSCSPNGTLLIVDPDVYDLVDFAADGSRHRLQVTPGPIRNPRVSPDGRLVAYVRGGEGSEEIWVHEIESGRENKISSSQPLTNPVWTHRGDLVYLDRSSGRFALRLAAPDGSRAASTLLESDQVLIPWSVSPTGVLLLSKAGEPMRLDLAHPGSAEPWSSGGFVWWPMFSPDGRWVAYSSDEGKTWVRPWSGPGGARSASRTGEGSWEPQWAPDGKTLYFETSSDEWPGWKLEKVDFREAGSDFVLGTSSVVGHFDVAGYDPKPDGLGFIRAERRKEPPSFTVVVNLTRQLQEHEQRAGVRP